MAQDDYYYEIQLTNKQLVFYFMAGATGLILSFLAGVMVGRGVDAGVDSAGRGVPVEEQRVATEEVPRVEPSTADLNYARRLEGERQDEGLQPAATPAAAAPAATPVPPTPTPRATPTPTPAPTPAPTARAAAPAPTPPPRSPEPTRPARATPHAAAPGTFAIQVGAFKDRKAADTVATRLKGKGFPAYVVSPDGAPNGLFNVRVGAYAERSDAELVQARLRDHEKYKPFIVRN